MAEVFIPRPGSSERERRGKSWKVRQVHYEKSSGTMNVGDVYCFVPETEQDYAEKVQRHGWKEVPYVRLFKKSTGISAGGTH